MTRESRWNEPILGSTSAKRQHYVPRSYLRLFADGEGLLRVVDLENNSEYKTAVGNAAVEHHFYDLTIGDKLVSAEDWLAQVEGQVAPVIGRLCSDPCSIASLDDEDEQSLARFIAVQILRPPAFRQWTDNVMETFLNSAKESIRRQLRTMYGTKEGEAIYDTWKDRPAHWWVGEASDPQPAATTAFLLGETHGFANLICAAPWRIGYALGRFRFYTSDNPVSGYLRPVRPWWEVGAFGDLQYYLPLSSDILLKVGRRPDAKDLTETLNPRGQRRKRDFSEWEVSLARHIVSQRATQFLYGMGTVVSKKCAESCLTQLEGGMQEFAARYLGYNPSPPTGMGFPPPHAQGASD